MNDVLDIFGKESARWFAETLGAPTPVQKEAWPAIAEGRHVLVSAPTGTGKTLSAFFVFLDQMARLAHSGSLAQELQLIYVSPLKSLAADIRENLKRPLAGIGAEGKVLAAIRTGDTPQSERQKMIRKPPHILIITPESLYLMLTSKTGQNVLSTARAVIVDELHALIDTKRGAHLMLSLARLDALCKRPLQRIGLSATIEPLKEAAEYLAPEEVYLAAPVMKKQVRLEIISPYPDVTRGPRKDPLWEELGELVYGYCQGSRSVIAFVEGRRYAEKLAYYVNLRGGEEFARVHHGSLSKEQRLETELSLRDGKLRLLCATSSMELGIDVGEIDRVLQIGCPRTVSGTMQRLGRAGHNPGRVSVMYLFPRTAAECVLCGMTAQLAREGGVERINPPEQCLDVLAQHLVSMAAFRSYDLDEVMEILPRAWPFRNITREDVRGVLRMLAGDYEHSRDVPARPRILYDRIHERVEGDGYSRMLAVSAGGTIPDKGLYTVKTEEGVKLGEVDEEFVYESQKGDRFILGAYAWKVVQISRDTVTVKQAPVEGARLPFWKGEIRGRDRRTGEAFGRIFRSLQEAAEDGRLPQALEALGLDEAAVKLACGYLERQLKATGSLPDNKTIIAEHFRDSSGNSQLMVHSVFGRRINAPFSLLAAHAAQEQYQMEVGHVDEEEGFLLYSYGDRPLPEGILQLPDPDTCLKILQILLPATPLFGMAFRYNCGRALMTGVRKNGRQPLWMQRLRSAEMLNQIVRETEHPLLRETGRECLTELWDAEGLRDLLCDIRSGIVKVREIYTEIPSPMSLPLQWSQEAAVMYDYSPTPGGVHAAVEEALMREREQGGEREMLHPGSLELSKVQEREKLPQDEKQLHALLMAEGDLAAGELDIRPEWLDALAGEGRAVYLEQGLWIAAEHLEEYTAALSGEVGEKKREEAGKEGDDVREARLHIIRRMLRYRGAADVTETAERYGLPAAIVEELFEELCHRKDAVRQDGRYYHAVLYRRARMWTLKNRRREVQTFPGEAFVSLLLSRMRPSGPPDECLSETLKRYAGTAFPAAHWEGFLLPARVGNYREAMLDAYLAGGEMFWRMEESGRVCFAFQEDIDWDAPLPRPEGLTEKEILIYEALLKRGASFMQSLGSLLPGESPHEVLLSLLEKGLVYADSFLPVRQWLQRGSATRRTGKAAVKQRVSMRVRALGTGRWDVVRPLKALSAEEKLRRCAGQYAVLCRETVAACGFSWQEALSVLRIQEYTGQVRRGYFIEGLSGAQFLRDEDFRSVVRELRGAVEEPETGPVWVNAADPAQCLGKLLPHREGRSFLNVPGTVAACCCGVPVAVMERQGKVLRLYEEGPAAECLRLFVEEYRRGKIFSAMKRIVVKEYPAGAGELLERAGFLREMQDYVLYR